MIQLANLKYFYDAYRLGSMTAAAELNRLTRPAISHAIRRLEEELGQELLVHKKRGFELTETGFRLGDAAEKVFGAVETMVTDLQEKVATKKHTGTLTIGVARVVATYRFDEVLSDLRLQNPDLQIKVRLENSEQIIDHLASREIDAALIISDEYRSGISHDVLRKGAFVLVAPKAMRQEKSGFFALTERRPETDAVRRIYRDKFRGEINVFAEIPSWDAIWNWIQRGHCGGLVPDLFLSRLPYRPVEVRKVLRDVYPYEIKFMYRDAKAQHSLIRDLRDKLQEAFH